MRKPLKLIATTIFENMELLSMERKGAKKRDSPQSRKVKGKYCEFMVSQPVPLID
jgi:hypothetical protein